MTLEQLLPALRILAEDPVFWLSVALLGVLFLYLAWIVTRPPAVISSFRTEAGSVNVSRHAVSDLVQRVCAATPGVGKASCSITSGSKGPVSLRIRLTLLASATLPELAGDLQERIASHLRHSFGFTEIGAIDILATAFSGDPAPAAQGEKPRPVATRDLGDNFPATFASGYDLPDEEESRSARR